jgi:hypothetical protein
VRKRKGRRPKSLESESDRVGDANPQTLIQSLVQSANLAEQPMEDPLFEKSIAATAQTQFDRFTERFAETAGWRELGTFVPSRSTPRQSR